MRQFSSFAVFAGLAAAVACINVASAGAAEDTAVPHPVEVAAQPVPTAEKAKKVVVKRKKSRRSKGAKNAPAAIMSVSPGDKMTLQQVMEILKTPGRDLSGKNLGGLRLVGVNLSRANLKGADLSHANLERADLEEANLERTDCSGTNLKMANLRLSGINATNLDRAILDGAIWKDGRICAAGSVGQCQEFAPPAPR